MTSVETTMASQHLNTSNNDEESIFLTSSDDDKDHESVDRDDYLAQEQYEDENNGYDEDASDIDDFAYGKSYDDDDIGRQNERRPIKVYDEYDPENIDNNEGDSDDDDDDDDDIPLNLYSKKKRQQLKKKDSEMEESSSDEEKTTDKPKKRGRPKRTQDTKSIKKPKNMRKQTSKIELKKKISDKKKVHSDSDSASSVSSVDSDNKSKKEKKCTNKNSVNTELMSNKNLVKKGSSSSGALKQKASKLSQAQNIISGRVINFESGFKIPKRPSNESSNEKEPPEKKSKHEERSPGEKIKTKDSKETVKAKQPKPSPPVSHAKPVVEKKTEKKIQPVKNGFKESMDFLEALSSSARKYSHTSKKPTLPAVSKSDTTKNESSQDKKLETSLKTNLESTCNSTPCLINRVETVDNSDPTSLLKSHSTSSDSSLLKLINSNGLKSNLIISGTRKIAKKKVVWADSCSQQLESVQFFYLDESERVIKKEAYHGADMSKVDKLSEKEFTFRIASGQSFADFNEEAASKWPASLVPIDLPESTIIAEIKSEEREIQARREANTLAVLVFKQFMPDSASEPDPEPCYSDIIKTRTIPLDETNSADPKLLNEEESDKLCSPSQDTGTKIKTPLLSNPTATKTPLLPTPSPSSLPLQPAGTSTEASGSKTESANILNLLNLSNLSSSILRSNEDAERLKKILSLVGASGNSAADIKLDDKTIADQDQPVKTNIPKTDTNNNQRWNNNSSNQSTNWQSNKYSNQTFNRSYNNQNSNQNLSQNQNSSFSHGRNVFVNNFKRGMGNRNAQSYSQGNNYRGNDSRTGFNRQNYAMHGQNRSRFGENKTYEDSERNESKPTQGGRWI